MKALDNLENYDIPAGFRLTAEQEVQFASDLKEIVHALIPIRGSKLHTRRYFNAHLRYTSNVQDATPKPSFPLDLDEPVVTYIPQPGEYTWNSDLLQPALLDILKPDQWSFGFVINYIIADVLIRWQKENDLPPVSDVSSVSHTIQPIQQIQENPIMAEIRKYISPEYWTEVASLIEEFDLELVSVTRKESEQ